MPKLLTGNVGGVRSGLDWRYHDGRPCGYEGLLADGCGVIALALERWGARREA